MFMKVKKDAAVKEVFDDYHVTLAEATILGQYLKGVFDQDTRAAEFVRDTAGEKPKLQVELEKKDNPFEGVSTEELLSFMKEVKEFIGDEDDSQ